LGIQVPTQGPVNMVSLAMWLESFNWALNWP